MNGSRRDPNLDAVRRTPFATARILPCCLLSIVTMLSKQHGKIRAVAKGVRRTASKFGSRLEPFMVVDVQLYEGRTLDIVTQAESIGAYGAEIASDYGSYTAANGMVKTTDKITDDSGSLQQYLLL